MCIVPKRRSSDMRLALVKETSCFQDGKGVNQGFFGSSTPQPSGSTHILSRDAGRVPNAMTFLTDRGACVTRPWSCDPCLGVLRAREHYFEASRVLYWNRQSDRFPLSYGEDDASSVMFVDGLLLTSGFAYWRTLCYSALY